MSAQVPDAPGWWWASHGMWAWSDTRALLQRRHPDALAAVERGDA